MLDNLNSLIRQNEFIIFKQNHDYHNEYKSVNSISLSDNNIIIIYNSPANFNQIKVLKNVFSLVEYENTKHNFLIFTIIDNGNLPEFLRNKLVSQSPINLLGFKVSGKKKYFVNYPPKIVPIENIMFHVYFEKKKISSNDINQIGKYTIKVNGYSNYNFELIELPVIDYIFNENVNSLIFNSLNYNEVEKGCINGLQIEYKNNINNKLLTINHWINTLDGTKINSENQLLKIISQSRNGKYS
jgi:hypothetical protein